MKVFISNKPVELAKVLHRELFSEAMHPLAKRWVIVPTEEVKRDLYLRWLETSDVIAGIQTITYGELMRKLFPEIPSKMELALRLETALEEVEELKEYLSCSIHKLELSLELSTLFLKYLQHPSQECLEGWQRQLWEKVFGSTLPTKIRREMQGSFFFYHITKVAPHEWEAFSRMQTAWFMFSPSQMFIGDLLPERQQRFLIQRSQELEGYFQKDSPLLSNWIGYGQKLLSYFEEVATIDCFKEPEAISALSTLQREWLTLEKKVVAPDVSIQLHSAPTLLQEVEVVWELLQKLPYEPREITVLAPDINLYAASIEWVFKQRGGAFECSIMGVEARTLFPLLQGMEILLSLPAHRFSYDLFSKLLLCLPFLKRFDLSLQEAEKLHQWMSELNLRYDLSGHSTSWHAALRRVIEGVVKTGSFDFSDTPLINRWIDITLKLEKELTPAMDGTHRTGKEWAVWIQRWQENFLEEEGGMDAISSVIATLQNDRVTGLFPYETVQRHLQMACAAPAGLSSNLNAVRFTSMKTGATAFAKAVICMGMQEGAFPRIDPPSSLPLMPVASRSVEDRYLFLETLAQAKELLILTYPRCHPDDGKEVRPSSIIQELAKDRGGISTFHHPASYYKKTQPTVEHTPLVIPPKQVIDMRVLKKLARHPVQCFLEESLGLRFPLKTTHSEFLLSPLEMHKLRQQSLRQTTGELIDALEKDGKLPSGTFRAVALQSIEKELELYKQTLAHLGVDPLSVFSLELSPYAQSIEILAENRRIAPALQVEGVEIRGTIEGITPQGVLFHGEESMEDLLKVWPLYLSVQRVLGNLPILLTQKAGVVKMIPEPDALGRYIGYLQKSMLSPSPLMPTWGRRLFRGEELPQKMEDEILLWAEKRNLLPKSEQWATEWRPYLQEVVRELL